MSRYYLPKTNSKVKLSFRLRNLQSKSFIKTDLRNSTKYPELEKNIKCKTYDDRHLISNPYKDENGDFQSSFENSEKSIFHYQKGWVGGGRTGRKLTHRRKSLRPGYRKLYKNTFQNRYNNQIYSNSSDGHLLLPALSNKRTPSANYNSLRKTILREKYHHMIRRKPNLL